ncbi:hypothetical protein FRC12_005144, partial [Ceratobasidium sp. 428]
MGSTTPKDTPDITSDTSIPQIILRLSESGCPDLTSRIDIPRCSQWSVTGGGHGDIYEGWLTNGDHVAIKTARGDESLDLSKGHIAFKRVARELYTWHKLSHQNIANLLGMGTFRGHIAMISPWIAPGDFYKFIDKFPGTDRMDLCIQVANGLTYLHKNKVVFGDLKAQNILIGHDGVAKLTDFGLSVLSEATCAFSTTHTTGAGSTRWMAPELLSDIPVNQSYESDIYALAMTFIEILTGAFPFPGLHDTAVMFRVMFKQAIPGRPEILEAQSLHHDSWWELLQRCWDRTPDRRPKASDWLALDERTAARQVNMDRPIITSSTTIPEIISLLSQSGCPDITNQLNLELCSQWSVDGGGQSDIYRGALLGGEQVAIKTTRKDQSLDFSKGNISFKRVARELHTWHRLDHRNTTKLLGVAVFHGHISMVSAWIEPGDYYKFIARYPHADRMDICLQVASGLAYLHEEGVVFGDVKGRNILVSHHGVAKLTDFGLSVLGHTGILFSITQNPGGGSTRWMAPELITDTQWRSFEADVYALGMTFIEILTDEFPFPELSEMNVMFAVATKSITPTRPLRLELQSLRNDRWWELLQKCWDRDP